MKKTASWAENERKMICADDMGPNHAEESGTAFGSDNMGVLGGSSQVS